MHSLQCLAERLTSFDQSDRNTGTRIALRLRKTKIFTFRLFRYFLIFVISLDSDHANTISRPAIRRSDAVKESQLCLDRHPHAWPGDRREHDDLQFCERTAAASARRNCRPGTARASRANFRK